MGNDRHAAGVSPPTIEDVLARLAERIDAAGGPEPLLVNARDLARILAVSAATLDRLQAAGRLPAPLTLGAGCRRWRLTELREWVACGCPGRQEWEGRRNGPKGTPANGDGR